MVWTRPETHVMTSLSGKTRNGFTYEAEYEHAGGGRVLWSATFRQDGDYAGMRHGTMHEMREVGDAALGELVSANIESTWTDAS